MAKGEVLGHIECPACGWADMEVRADKKGNPYGYCIECNQQIFTHGGTRGAHLLARMRKASAPAADPAPTTPAGSPREPAPEDAPAPKRRAASTLLG